MNPPAAAGTWQPAPPRFQTSPRPNTAPTISQTVARETVGASPPSQIGGRLQMRRQPTSWKGASPHRHVRRKISVKAIWQEEGRSTACRLTRRFLAPGLALTRGSPRIQPQSWQQKATRRTYHLPSTKRIRQMSLQLSARRLHPFPRPIQQAFIRTPPRPRLRTTKSRQPGSVEPPRCFSLSGWRVCR